jgi:general secretion pathway protein M
MSIAENARRQTLVSYAILAAAVLAVAFAALASPIRERAGFFASLELQRATYTKSLEALARSEAVGAQFEFRRAASDPAAQTFHGDTPALAGAELQNQLNALIAAEGGKLLSAGFRESTDDGALTPLAVTVRLRCSMDALLRILHGLENRTPVLFIETLTVQSRRRGGGPPRRQEDGELDVEIDVVGYLAARPAP